MLDVVNVRCVMCCAAYVVCLAYNGGVCALCICLVFGIQYSVRIVFCVGSGVVRARSVYIYVLCVCMF